MKHYPSIQHSSKAPRQPCYAFIKYDGSNLRFEWSKKQGWHKFGTRNLLFDETSPVFGEAIPLFLQKYADDLSGVFKKEKTFRSIDRFIVFGEWFGAKSFSGGHQPDDPKDIILFDVNPHKKGIIGPKQFLDIFGHLKVAECVWTGNLGEELISNVRASNLEFIDFVSKYEVQSEVPEGIICKGGSEHNLWMCKIKTQNYYDQLKVRHPQDWEKLWQEEFQ